MEQNQQININPFIQNEMGRLNYENILLKARLDYETKMNQELLQKVQELEKNSLTQRKQMVQKNLGLRFFLLPSKEVL